MCGRYFFDDTTADDVELELGLESGSFSMKSGDVTPGMSPVVLFAGKDIPKEQIAVTNMLWGLTGKDKKLVINARAESANEKPMFSAGMECRRCIMPAAGFYEWDREKNKVSFLRPDKKPIYLAGLYDISDNRNAFVILTTAANESMIKVHDRMPVMIESGKVYDWLYDRDAAKEMLKREMPSLVSRRDYEQLSLFD